MLRFMAVAMSLYLICLYVASVHAFQTTVDMETTDCGKEFSVDSFSEYQIKAQPVFTPIGGADSCKVKFTSDDRLRIYVQDFHVNDCTVKLQFYDNDPSETREMFMLSCPPHDPPSDRVLTTETGKLTIRLDKASGTTSSYQFVLKLTTLKAGSNALSATGGGGGISTGAIIGIIGGVVVFLVIIIALVLYFVCKQMREKKEEEMRRMEAPVFTTAASHNFDTTDRGESWSRMERERDRDRARERERETERYREREQPRLPEPKVNGILKNSPSRRRRRRENTGDGGFDNEGYTPSVSSTEEGSDFDYETYQRAIEQGVPSGNAKNFSMFPDPPKDRRDRRERRRHNDTREFRSASQTSDSSADEGGFVNPSFTDDRGRQIKSASLGKISGKKYADSESSRRSVDDSVSALSRSTRTGSYRSRTRSYSPSRTDGSRDSSDTGTSITTGSGSRFQRNPNDASIRRSRSRSQNRSSGRSVPRKQRHQQQVHDPSQGAQQQHHHHHHRSRSRDRKKDAYLPVFADAKKLAKQKK